MMGSFFLAREYVLVKVYTLYFGDNAVARLTGYTVP